MQVLSSSCLSEEHSFVHFSMLFFYVNFNKNPSVTHLCDQQIFTDKTLPDVHNIYIQTLI